METILNLLTKSVEQVALSLLHNWPYLLASVVIATALKLFVDVNKVSAFLARYRGVGVVAATAAAVGTPLCSCGTTAIVLGMMASSMSWAPIVAFMVSSPLTSPEGLVYSAGLFGWPFALTFFLASIVLGLGGGWLAAVVESRGWLANQIRFAEAAPAPCACSANPAATRVYGLDTEGVTLEKAGACCTAPAPVDGCACGAQSAAAPQSSCGCGQAPTPAPIASTPCGCGAPSAETAPSTCGCAQAEPLHTVAESSCGCSASAAAAASPAAEQKPRVTPLAFLRELFSTGKRLLFMFLGFAFVGYLLNNLIPASWVAALFGSGNVYSVPLAATLGLPFYINSETSLPLIRALIEGGMSQGAAMAFMIAGAGTSIGAITGALTIARWRVVGLVVGVLWVGAILSGYAFNLLVALKVF